MICRFTADLNLFGYFTRPTLAQFGDLLPFDTLPLYALLHEPIYAREYVSHYSRTTLLTKDSLGVHPTGLQTEL